MRLIVNGLSEEVDVATVAQLLARRGVEARAVVVAVNRDCVPRSALDSTTLREGDEVEILAPMQGG